MRSYQYMTKELVVIKSFHTNEHRYNSKFSRDQFIDSSRYHDIVQYAMWNGLTSFRSKGHAVISFLDYLGRQYSILVELNDKNELSIITVYCTKSKKDVELHFKKVSNRVNLFNSYVMPKMDSKQLKDKVIDKKNEIMKKIERSIDNVCRNEDGLFLKAMKYAGVQK